MHVSRVSTRPLFGGEGGWRVGTRLNNIQTPPAIMLRGKLSFNSLMVVFKQLRLPTLNAEVTR